MRRWLAAAALLAAVMATTARTQASPAGGGSAPVGAVGTTFHLASGLSITLLKVKPAPQLYLRPGGPVLRPSGGDVFKVAIWKVVDQRRVPVSIGSFYSKSRGAVRRAFLAGGKPEAGVLHPGESETITLAVEIGRNDPNAMLLYSQGLTPRQSVARWRVG